MIILISPAKTLDFSACDVPASITKPRNLKDSAALVDILKKKSKKDLQKLMSISAKLADQVYSYYSDFKAPFTKKNSKPAILTFKGDVYRAFDFSQYKKADYERLQNKVRILSGLYGILRPLDLMQAYRLEMGTKLKNNKGKNLYEFWGDKISKQINKDAKEAKAKAIINLASDEYFEVVKPEILNLPLIKVSFKEKKAGKYKVIGILAKRARGLMTDYIIKNKVNSLDRLKKFNVENYKYSDKLSDQNEMVFIRG